MVLALQVLKQSMYATQTKTWKFSCGAFLHNTYNQGGLRRLHSQHVSYTMSHKRLKLYYLYYWMERENGENASTRQIRLSELVKVILFKRQSRIEAFELLSQPNMSEQVTPTMNQRWINGGPSMDQLWINGISRMDQRCINGNLRCVT